MFKEQKNSSRSGSSTKGDEVEIVSRFLAPLCDRDETARNIALAAAQTTVEGWLGGFAGPENQWEEGAQVEKSRYEPTEKFKSQDGRYDMSIERSPIKFESEIVNNNWYSDNQIYPINNIEKFNNKIDDNFGTESFFPQSVTDNVTFSCDKNFDDNDKYLLDSFDCVDGKNLSTSTTKEICQRHCMDTIVDNNFVQSATASSDETKGLRIENRNKRFNHETRFSSSGDNERKLLNYLSSEKINELQQTNFHDDIKQRYCKNKGNRQKYLEDDDDLDSDTRLYGKSPKFDNNNMENFDYFETNYRNYLSSSEPGRSSIDHGTSGYFFDFDDTSLDDDNNSIKTRNIDGVVFNTLDGFENNYMIPSHDKKNLSNEKIIKQSRCYESFQDNYLRINDDRKLSAGQIKRPLSQDENVSSKSGRLIEGPEVTPGDVGRMLNLGNALDGPRQQTQPNKYLSLVTMHLPVILRLSVNCPFQNVRFKCTEILQMVKDRGLPVPEATFDGPSAFVPTSHINIAFGKIIKKKIAGRIVDSIK